MTLSVADFERRVTAEAVEEVHRYLERILEKGEDSPSILDLFNLARQTSGRPLSNSMYLHEIEEILQLRLLGRDPFGYIDDRSHNYAHRQAVKIEYEYLIAVARSMEYDIHISALKRVNPIGKYGYYKVVFDPVTRGISIAEKPDDPLVGHKPTDEMAIRFFKELLQEEPQFMEP